MDALVLGVWAALCLVLAVRLAGFAPDDMFITYRYAWNLAHGEGLTFNPGERVFGLTNPGLAVSLALLHAVTRAPVHILGSTVFALGLWCLSACLWIEARDRGRRAEILIGGTLILGSSYIWAAAGSASASVAALLSGSAILVRKRPVTAGVLAGLSVWYRPDAVIGVVALGLFTWLEARRFPRRWAFAAGGVILLGLVAAWLWFGSFLPNTLEAKRTMAASREAAWIGPERFWARGVPLFQRHFGSAWLVLFGLGLVGLWPLFARGGRAVRTLVVYGAGVAVAYPLLSVPFYSWYTIPPITAMLLGVGASIAGVARTVIASLSGHEGSISGSRSGRLPVAIAVAVALGVLLYPPARSVTHASMERFESFGAGGRFDSYRKAALWIREHSRPDERIAYAEIGMLAYWSRRSVDDPLGLVTPEALPYVAVGDWVGAILRRPPDLFVDHPASPHPGIVRLPWFQAAYERVARFPGEEPIGTADVYRKRAGAKLPAPRPPLDRRSR